MPRLTKFQNSSPEEKKSIIIQSARKAVKRGQNCSDKEKLQRIRQFNDIEAQLYIESYQIELALTPDFLLRKARYEAQRIAVKGGKPPSDEILRKKYNPEQITAFHVAFQNAQRSPEEQLIRRARKAGKQAARQAVFLLPEDELMRKKNYSLAEATAYCNAYNESAGTPEEQMLLRAKISGRNAVMHNIPLLSIQELMQIKGFSKEEAEAYTNGYNLSIQNPEKQLLRKARIRGQHAAAYGYYPPDKLTVMMRNNCNDAEAEAYIQAYYESRGTSEDQKLRKARRLARADSSRHISLLPKEQLMCKKGYSAEEADVYIEAFKKTTLRHSIKDKIAALLPEFPELLQEQLTVEMPILNGEESIAIIEDPLGYLEKLMNEAETIHTQLPFAQEQPATFICNKVNADPSPIVDSDLFYIESLLFVSENNSDSTKP